VSTATISSRSSRASASYDGGVVGAGAAIADALVVGVGDGAGEDACVEGAGGVTGDDGGAGQPATRNAESNRSRFTVREYRTLRDREDATRDGMAA